jgi:Ca-activated chloride channel family protein
MVMMTLFSKKLLSGILVVLLLSIAAPGQSGRRLPSGTEQQQEPAPKQKEGAIKLSAEEVLLNVTVTDSYGHQAGYLGKDDFIIAEDGQRQDIASFEVATVPVNVVLLLDASGSVINEISSLRNAAEEFVKRLSSEDKVSIMEFHLKVELIQDWTSDKDDMLHAISWRFKPGQIPKHGGNTALFDSLYLAANEQLSKVEGRKAIIILTDGDDNSSKLTYEQGLAAVIHSGAVVYVVSKARLFIEEYKRYGRLASGAIEELTRAESVMTDLATRTGGQIFSPLTDAALTEMYGVVAKELKSQYIITYVPKNEAHNGALRHVKVYLTRPGYSARTRESYYAPKG